jgi:hypothetical protein
MSQRWWALLWRDLALIPHKWSDQGPLTEPGISDVYDGAYSRYLVVCTRCGDTRKVWVAASPRVLPREGCSFGLRFLRWTDPDSDGQAP